MIGDFNDWQMKPAYRMKKVKRSNGVWEIELKPEAMKHGDLYKLKIIWEGGEGERIPSYANRVVQDDVTKIFSAQVCSNKAIHLSPSIVNECKYELQNPKSTALFGISNLSTLSPSLKMKEYSFGSSFSIIV